ncbi:MAG TPA: hypothetical protein DCF70_03575, partial [Treponema sp.]|nr:hypothetical protein [Treponema sp.]
DKKNEGKNKKFTNLRTQKSDRNELDKLSGMTSEQRMRYYKEKYAKSGAKSVSGKTNKSNKQQPKKGLLAKIRSLFGKK